MKIETALISVYYKDGLIDFVRELITLGVKTIYGSRGTAAYLNEANLSVKITDIAEIVGEPILGHRVVTLSREVHATLLAQYIENDLAELTNLGLLPINLVCVDMYPEEATISNPASKLADVLDKMDIGGPTMLSSGSKGQRVVIGDKNDRQKVIDWMKAGQPDEIQFIEALAAKADFMVSTYRMLTATFRSDGKYAGIFGERIAVCKYGENAHQTPAALFSTGSDDPLALDKFKVIEGTPPSYNNWCDIDRLLQTMTHLMEVYSQNGRSIPAIAIGAKHGNLCGASIGGMVATKQHLNEMISGDPLAIFGGLVMTNFAIDEDFAGALSGKMLDGIIAPDISEQAIELLRRKKDKCRFIVNTALSPSVTEPGKFLDTTSRFRYVRGGFLRQPNYIFVMRLDNPELKKIGSATEREEFDMLKAWAIGSTSNSNTVTLIKDGILIGNGVGQQDRVGAAKLAIERATRSGHSIKGASAYSDSFFPFPDGPKTLIDAGVNAILTSSGSLRDQATIDVCMKNGVVLYMIPDTIGRGFFGH